MRASWVVNCRSARVAAVLRRCRQSGRGAPASPCRPPGAAGRGRGRSARSRPSPSSCFAAHSREPERRFAPPDCRQQRTALLRFAFRGATGHFFPVPAPVCCFCSESAANARATPCSAPVSRRRREDSAAIEQQTPASPSLRPTAPGYLIRPQCGGIRVVVIADTRRETATTIISARKANARERDRHGAD
jgi:uncharacterized DUF497 family protein